MYDLTYENPQVLAEQATRTTTRDSYSYGATGRVNDTKTGTSYLYDGRGSVSEVLSSNGVTAQRYDIYGELTAGEPEQDRTFGYNGEQYTPQNGLTYLRARHYDASTGTFTTKDSYLGNQYDPVSQNRYTYADNDPVNRVDPSGHKSNWLQNAWNTVKGWFGGGSSASGAIKKAASGALKGAGAIKKIASGGGSGGGGSSSGGGGSAAAAAAKAAAEAQRIANLTLRYPKGMKKAVTAVAAGAKALGLTQAQTKINEMLAKGATNLPSAAAKSKFPFAKAALGALQSVASKIGQGGKGNAEDKTVKEEETQSGKWWQTYSGSLISTTQVVGSTATSALASLPKFVEAGSKVLVYDSAFYHGGRGGIRIVNKTTIQSGNSALSTKFKISNFLTKVEKALPYIAGITSGAIEYFSDDTLPQKERVTNAVVVGVVTTVSCLAIGALAPLIGACCWCRCNRLCSYWSWVIFWIRCFIKY